MKVRRINRTSTAGGAATVANLSLPSDVDVQGLPAIPEGDFQRILQATKDGELTESEFQQVHIDRQRAARKRKNATSAGNHGDAASASSREQTITEMTIPYALSGVRARSGQKKGGLATAAKAAKKAKATKTDVHELATQLLASHSARDISGIICQRTGLSRTTVLKHLRDHISGRWASKKR